MSSFELKLAQKLKAKYNLSMELRNLTVVIKKEDDMYVSFCPDIDVASQGVTIEEAKENLKEAVELFFEAASSNEISNRLHDEMLVTSLQVAVG